MITFLITLAFSYNAYECEMTEHISIHEEPILCVQKKVDKEDSLWNIIHRKDKKNYYSIFIELEDQSFKQLNSEPMLFEDSVELARKLTRNCTCARVDLDLASIKTK